MTSHAQKGRIDAAVMAEIDAHMKRGGWAAHADGLTGLQHHRATWTPLQNALANAEWHAADDKGRLPADWPERRARIEAQFTNLIEGEAA